MLLRSEGRYCLHCVPLNFKLNTEIIGGVSKFLSAQEYYVLIKVNWQADIRRSRWRDRVVLTARSFSTRWLSRGQRYSGEQRHSQGCCHTLLIDVQRRDLGVCRLFGSSKSPPAHSPLRLSRLSRSLAVPQDLSVLITFLWANDGRWNQCCRGSTMVRGEQSGKGASRATSSICQPE